MAGQRGVDGDYGRFIIANFSDHDHIRVLSEGAAQTFGEAVTFFRFRLGLNDALEVVLYGVLNSNHFDVGRINFF